MSVSAIAPQSIALATSLFRESLTRSRFIQSMRSSTSGGNIRAARGYALVGRRAIGLREPKTLCKKLILGGQRSPRFVSTPDEGEPAVSLCVIFLGGFHRD
jgi:hypothetical protein